MSELTTLRIRGNKDRVTGRYQSDGLVILRDGVCVEAAPVWGHWIGKPLRVIEATADHLGYIVDEVTNAN